MELKREDDVLLVLAELTDEALGLAELRGKGGEGQAAKSGAAHQELAQEDEGTQVREGTKYKEDLSGP